MRDLFGLELPTAVTFAIAFVVVLALIGILAWAVRRFGATRLEAARSRQPRLAVVDSAAVDGRRKLVIVRRDNVEHLLMIGGPTDVVVEASIVRGGAAATREAPSVRAGADNLPRAMPLPDSTLWPLQPEPVIAPAPMPAPAFIPAPAAAPAARVERSMRLHVDPRILTEHRPAPEVRTAPEPRIAAPEPRVTAAEASAHWPSQPEAAPATRAQVDHLASLAADLARPAAEVRHAPQPAPAVAPAPAALIHPDAQAGAGDQNLAEMAQRLEAALRRPMAQQHTAHVAAQPAAAPQPAAHQPAPQAAAPQASAPQVFAPQAPAHQAVPAPQAAPAQRPAPQRTAAAAPKGGAQPKPQYDNLEQEMASLLGRPGKT